MDVQAVARANYEQQERLGNATIRRALQLWATVHPGYIAASFREALPLLLPVITTAQAAAALTADRYVDQAVEAQGHVGLPQFDVIPEAFAGTASDGRPLASLLAEPVIRAKQFIAGGMTPTQALRAAGSNLSMIVGTQVADANRAATQAAITGYTTFGWVRMLNPPSCSRCAILAGQWYRWNQGFQRHPRCDCRHIPAQEHKAKSLTTDPYAYFRSLADSDQDRLFGRSNARAIRDGSDIYRVVNIQTRGLAPAGSRQAAKYGTPTRMTPDQIYRVAGTRTNAIQMLTQHGYITGTQTAGGNILGRNREGYGALGKGGHARAATNAVLAARASGSRDPLNRYTMTEQERRLYDAAKRVEAVNRGVNPFVAVGTKATPLTAQQAATARQSLANELAQLNTAPPSVQKLARALRLL